MPPVFSLSTYSPSPLIRNHRFGVRGSDFLPKNKKFQKFSPYFLFLKISPRNAHKEIMKELYFFFLRAARARGWNFLSQMAQEIGLQRLNFLLKDFLLKGLDCNSTLWLTSCLMGSMLPSTARSFNLTAARRPAIDSIDRAVARSSRSIRSIR